MGRIAVERLWSRHNVPMEIWSEILVRLPVRSLVRFRCVSRLWKAVIDDSDFCREHFVQFKSNRNETHLLMVQRCWDGAEHCFVLCSDTMETSRRLCRLECTDRPGFNCNWSIWFSVDGLVMLRCSLNNVKLILWNPSIRKRRLLTHPHDTTKFLEFGLGFDPLIKDYKLVRVSRCSVGSVEIYIVGTASWRTVVAQGTVTASWLPTARERESIYFKGSLYICSESELVSFDLSIEVFKSVNLPGYDNSAPKATGESLALVDGGSSLGVLQFSTLGGSIWVLDDNAASAAASPWSIRCTFSVSVPRFLYLKKNGDLLFDSMCSIKTVSSYNIHTEAERQIKYPKMLFCYLIHGYKESLVLLK